MKVEPIYINTELAVLRNTAGKITGAELISDGSAHSDHYLKNFMKSYIEKEAGISFKKGFIVFFVENDLRPMVCKHGLREKELNALRNIISSEDPDPSFWVIKEPRVSLRIKLQGKVSG